MTGTEVLRTAEEMISYYEELVKEFPVVSIEDGLDQEDWTGWSLLTKRLGNKVRTGGR